MDKDRAKYYRSVTGMEWGDARTYDLCLNTSLLGIEKSCDLVEHAVRIFCRAAVSTRTQTRKNNRSLKEI